MGSNLVQVAWIFQVSNKRQLLNLSGCVRESLLHFRKYCVGFVTQISGTCFFNFKMVDSHLCPFCDEIETLKHFSSTVQGYMFSGTNWAPFSFRQAQPQALLILFDILLLLEYFMARKTINLNCTDEKMIKSRHLLEPFYSNWHCTGMALVA